MQYTLCCVNLFILDTPLQLPDSYRLCRELRLEVSVCL
jgi:hypothetical protein